VTSARNRRSDLAVTELIRRADRADELAPRAPSAEAPLRFGAGLYRAQAEVAGALLDLAATRPLSGALETEVAALLPASRAVLRHAAEAGPPPLAAAARAQLDEPDAAAGVRLLSFWRGEHGTVDDYLSRARLRPYLGVLRQLGVEPSRVREPRSCPHCGGPPQVSSRRAPAPSEGAQRFAACAFCGGEWPAGRGSCLICGETEPQRLPAYRVDAYPTVRIEACESCHYYVKSLDLTVDARQIPEVDDLVSLAVDLRAQADGFLRFEVGLAGV
jgi:FdhE protein